MAGSDAAASPQEIARRVADAMWADDRASQALGMRIDAVG
ncbi:MAG: phenylacetic acid degradation protein PaaD, partial [Alphaproteobacteria bacterium]|nr:phenylacetic acid degradation protein PaaD [Alphaproteobacteria bacterium]